MDSLVALLENMKKEKERKKEEERKRGGGAKEARTAKLQTRRRILRLDGDIFGSSAIL